MPVYTYQVINPDGSEGETFDVVMKMSDPPLTHHPESGLPVQRVYTAPNIAGKWGDRATKANMSDSNLERLGFTKYQKTGKGNYERTAGKEGPSQISVND